MKLAKSHWSWLRRCWIPSQKWHLSLGWKSVLRRNTGECIVLIIVARSSLAVVNINHLVPPPPLSCCLFSFSSLSSHILFEFIKLAYIFFPCFVCLFVCLILWPPALLCLPHLLGFHVASFYVRTLIITLFCTSNPSSCPARPPSTALWPMGLCRVLILLPAPLSLQRATRSKVCAWLFSSLLPLVSFSKKLNYVASSFKSKNKTCEDYLESPLL